MRQIGASDGGRIPPPSIIVLHACSCPLPQSIACDFINLYYRRVFVAPVFIPPPIEYVRISGLMVVACDARTDRLIRFVWEFHKLALHKVSCFQIHLRRNAPPPLIEVMALHVSIGCRFTTRPLLSLLHPRIVCFIFVNFNACNTIVRFDCSGFIKKDSSVKCLGYIPVPSSYHTHIFRLSFGRFSVPCFLWLMLSPLSPLAIISCCCSRHMESSSFAFSNHSLRCSGSGSIGSSLSSMYFSIITRLSLMN